MLLINVNIYYKIGEELPGFLACENNGSFKKLDDGENLISKMSNYYEFLSSSTYSSDQGLWTSPYIDSGGLGLTITYAVPTISKKDQKYITIKINHTSIQNS